MPSGARAIGLAEHRYKGRKLGSMGEPDVPPCRTAAGYFLNRVCWVPAPALYSVQLPNWSQR